MHWQFERDTWRSMEPVVLEFVFFLSAAAAAVFVSFVKLNNKHMNRNERKLNRMLPISLSINSSVSLGHMLSNCYRLLLQSSNGSTIDVIMSVVNFNTQMNFCRCCCWLIYHVRRIHNRAYTIEPLYTNAYINREPLSYRACINMSVSGCIDICWTVSLTLSSRCLLFALSPLYCVFFFLLITTLEVFS